MSYEYYTKDELKEMEKFRPFAGPFGDTGSIENYRCNLMDQIRQFEQNYYRENIFLIMNVGSGDLYLGINMMTHGRDGAWHIVGHAGWGMIEKCPDFRFRDDDYNWEIIDRWRYEYEKEGPCEFKEVCTPEKGCVVMRECSYTWSRAAQAFFAHNEEVCSELEKHSC
jgi:hypothetical protein